MSSYDPLQGDLAPAAVWPRRIRWLHWTILATVVLGVSAILSRDWVDDSALRKTLLALHWKTGLSILLLTSLRAALRVRTPHPRAPGRRTSSEILASAVHALFYAILVALPLLGWAYMSAKGKSIDFLGIALPALVSRDRDLAETLQSAHTTLGWTLLVLIGLHALAALWHHWVAKDDTLRGMLGVSRAKAAIAPPTTLPPNFEEQKETA
jgi:cytochrome b561